MTTEFRQRVADARAHYPEPFRVVCDWALLIEEFRCITPTGQPGFDTLEASRRAIADGRLPVDRLLAILSATHPLVSHLFGPESRHLPAAYSDTGAPTSRTAAPTPRPVPRPSWSVRVCRRAGDLVAVLLGVSAVAALALLCVWLLVQLVGAFG
jgi:hypothetical protein